MKKTKRRILSNMFYWIFLCVMFYPSISVSFDGKDIFLPPRELPDLNIQFQNHARINRMTFVDILLLTLDLNLHSLRLAAGHCRESLKTAGFQV